MILECHNEYRVYTSFDPAKGCRQKVSCKPDEAIKINGIYAEFKGVFMCLYVDDMEAIVFRYMNNTFELRYGVTIEVEGEIKNRRLLVFFDGNLKKELSYAIDNYGILRNDPTPFVENEDFDFGLWVSNISKSESRKKVLYDYYS